jgi:hypothetical protein
MAVMDALVLVVRGIQWVRGGLDGAIARAGGAMQ